MQGEAKDIDRNIIKVPTMPGYELSSADRSVIDKKNLCPKCEGLLREAVQTIACGHRYCKTCVETILWQEVGKCIIDGSDIHREQRLSPVSLSVLRLVFLDRFVEREIQSLLVHCIHQEKGCD
ncbi:unnamed protein product [Porites lobata]|uniref:Zinc finger C3HC4 RING-type domain-containing protein n=1 Tax=Porites lobata TaxID=104759 RepID=A0ABN8RHV5_9CNID|nr:unnamed protein product [Porites lobata]